MIYIFDDRSQRRKVNKEKLNKFSNVLSFGTIKTIPGKSIEESLIESMNDNPECIIFHKSYVFDDSNLSYETVREFFNSYDVPVVIFSGGTEKNNKGEKEINMNAELMYDNLPFFLEDYVGNGKINLEILVWGKRYQLNTLLILQNKLAEEFFITNDLEEEVKNLEKVRRIITNLCKPTHRVVGDAIFNSIDKFSKITWGQLDDIITNTISQYK